jgi:hypothetical protein
MLIRLSELKNFQLRATDGDIGRCRDFLFDDEYWAIRYMEANTSKWLLGQRVLISPKALQSADLPADRIELNISKKQVEEAPGIEQDQPVSRQYEQAYANYFKHGFYWIGGAVWGAGHNPYTVEPPVPQDTPTQDLPEAADDEHLRSTEKVSGYAVQARDGEIGSIDDFIVETADWRIALLGIDTRKWLPGRTVLLPVEWVRDISWQERHVEVDVTRDALKSAPELKEPVTYDDVKSFCEHFDRTR